MILGIGVDVVHVRRIHHWLETPGLVDRFFHPDEITASLGRGHAAALSLAARFAAKEAMMKALGHAYGWREIEVIRGKGAPTLRLHGRAQQRAAAVGIRHIHLSLSHTATLAIAYVIAES